MISTSSLFSNTQLAEASYAKLWDVNTQTVITAPEQVSLALRDAANKMSFSEKQAADLLATLFALFFAC